MSVLNIYHPTHPDADIYGFVDVCDCEYHVYADGTFRKVGHGDQVWMNNAWVDIECTQQFQTGFRYTEVTNGPGIQGWEYSHKIVPIKIDNPDFSRGNVTINMDLQFISTIGDASTLWIWVKAINPINDSQLWIEQITSRGVDITRSRSITLQTVMPYIKFDVFCGRQPATGFTPTQLIQKMTITSVSNTSGDEFRQDSWPWHYTVSKY